jgi:hypothetical protein
LGTPTQARFKHVRDGDSLGEVDLSQYEGLSLRHRAGKLQRRQDEHERVEAETAASSSARRIAAICAALP